MKRKPILKTEFMGCGNCGKMVKLVLENDDTIWNCDFMDLTLNGQTVWLDDNMTVSSFLEKYKIKKDDEAEIFYMSAFHDELYELDTEDMKFKLVEQGEGYA